VAQLHVALREGFAGEEVVVSVDGREVFRDRVTTRLQIGLASSFDLDVAEGDREVAVDIGGSEAGGPRTVPVAGQTWVGVSLIRDRAELDWTVSDEPFGYV
jgi:hypothetical protein